MAWRRLPLPFLRERARPEDITPRHQPGLSARQAELVKRVRFVVALARSLHSYGTAAPRLENAVTEVAATMGLVCNVNSSPTSLVFSFRAQGGPETILNEVTRVVRLEPGGRDLHRLSLADAVAEQVLDGELDVDAGYARLLEIEAMPGLDERLVVISYGLIATALAVILGQGWADAIAALVIGTGVGLVDRYCAHRPHLRPSSQAVCALLATVLIGTWSHFLMPLSVQSVVLASLLVLLPGLTLTTAINELATDHLVSGVARFAGAFAVLLKLAFGVVAGSQILMLLGWVDSGAVVTPVPDWMLWPALLLAGFGFAISFGAAWRDFPLVMAAAICSFLVSRYFGITVGNEFGVFLAALTACAAGNLYARVFRRPGALIRFPGIILLVPGSIGFRGLTQVFERDIFLSLSTGYTLLVVLVTLVAGLLFGNLLVPPRRSL